MFQACTKAVRSIFMKPGDGAMTRERVMVRRKRLVYILD